jgi:LDH2 family malate/lactate/ureidoglycolate dehydrogenase
MKLCVQEFFNFYRTTFEKHGISNDLNAVCTEQFVDAHCRGPVSPGPAMILEVLEVEKGRSDGSDRRSIRNRGKIDGMQRKLGSVQYGHHF